MKKNRIIIPLVVTMIIGSSLAVRGGAADVRTVDFIHILALGVSLGILATWSKRALE